MKVLFLDIDGVLNSDALTERVGLCGCRDIACPKHLDVGAVRHLDAIVRRTNARVVISSTWRKQFAMRDIVDSLRRLGFSGVVVGQTPALPSRRPDGSERVRGDEIAAWVAAVDVEAFAILDDNDDMGPVRDRLIHIDPASGLQPEHVERAVAMLTPPITSTGEG